MIRRLFLSLLAPLVLSQVISPALAQSASDYPVKQITMVVGYPPGGTTDLFARVLSTALSTQMGITVIVENKDGAAGNLGSLAVSGAKPDGATLLFATSSIVLNPALGMQSAVGALAGLEPVAGVSTGAFMLITNNALPVNNIREFVDYVKARPGTVNYASGGQGDPSHLAAALFLNHMDLSATHVGYKGGTPARAAVTSGEVAFYMDSVGDAFDAVHAGQVRGLAVTSLNRSAVAPEIPTINETVSPGFQAVSWYGVMAPTGTPDAIVQRLYSEISKALDTPDLQAALATAGLDIKAVPPQDFGAFIKKDGAQWSALIQAGGIKMN